MWCKGSIVDLGSIDVGSIPAILIFIIYIYYKSELGVGLGLL